MAYNDTAMRSIICLLFACLLMPALLQAQVKLYAAKNLIGKAAKGDLCDVSVTNFTGVEIEFVLEAKAVAEDGSTLLEVTSPVLSCEPGASDFGKQKIDDLVWTKSAVELSSYTGTLTYYMQIVHPAQRASIIATAEKKVQLRDGYYVDEQGKLAVDPQLVQPEITLGYSEQFELDALWKYFEIANGNAVQYCEDFLVWMSQGNAEIYRIQLPEKCFEPEKSQFTKEDFARGEVLVDDFATRSKSEPINIYYRLGDRAPGRRLVNNVQHFKLSSQPGSYVSEALSLVLEYPEFARVSSGQIAENGVLVFDKSGALDDVEALEMHMGTVDLGLQNPYGFTIDREDVNGKVSVSALPSNNLDQKSWKSFLASIDQVDREDILLFEKQGLKVFTPNQLYNEEKREGWNVSLNGMTLLLQDEYLSLLISAKSSVPNPDKPDNRITLDLQQFFSSLRYNGQQLQLIVDDDGDITDVDFRPASDPITQEHLRARHKRYLDYWQYMQENSIKKIDADTDDPDQIHKEFKDRMAKQPLTGEAKFDGFKVVRPGQINLGEYERFSWDTAQVAFSYRKGNRPIRAQASSDIVGYLLDEQGIVKEKHHLHPKAAVTGPHLDQYPTKYQMHHQSLLAVLPAAGQSISVSKLERLISSEKELKAIVSYESSGSQAQHPEIEVFESSGWKVYASKPALKATRYSGQRSALLIDTGSSLYLVQATVLSRWDLYKMMNSLEIEGRSLQLEVDEDGMLVGVE